MTLSPLPPGRILARAASAGAALALAAWIAPELAAQLLPPPTSRTPPPSETAAPGVRFTDITESAGIRFQSVSGSPAKDYIVESTGSGVGFLDFDNDGHLDIYLLNGSNLEAVRKNAPAPRAALYRNLGKGTFVDVTERAGLGNERWGQGLCAGDVDNDGWVDLYVTNFGRNRLYRNSVNGTFTDVAEKAGVALGGWSTGCAFGDYDGDGRLDLFVAGYVQFDVDRPPPPATASQTPETRSPSPLPDAARAPGTGAALTPGRDHCTYRGRRVMCGPRGLKGERDHLFRNNGDGTFADVSVKAGVADAAGLYGFGVAWFDSNDDGRLDLFVANDSTPNYLYLNRGDGSFEDVSLESGTALNEDGREQAGMGVAVGDYDGDGRDDLHVTNFSDDLNTLRHNDDGRLYSETTRAAGLGITRPFLGWGTNFFDYDNDGALDLLVANGHVYPNLDEAGWGTSYKQRLLLFRNLAGRLVDVGSSAGEALNVPFCARGSSVGDVDNDGDLDILIGNLDDRPRLLRNDGGSEAGHWLGVTLRGDPALGCPRDAVGSVVFCTAGGRRMRATVASGQSFYAQSDLRLHFGLGKATSVERLEVRWANGRTERYSVKGVDRMITIVQGRGAGG